MLSSIFYAIEATPVSTAEAITNSTPKLRDRLGERKDISNIAQVDLGL